MINIILYFCLCKIEFIKLVAKKGLKAQQLILSLFHIKFNKFKNRCILYTPVTSDPHSAAMVRKM